MEDDPEVGPTPEEPAPPGPGRTHESAALFRLIELLVLLEDSSPTTLVLAGLLWALYTLRAAKQE
jgi:hypothetical protein